MPGRAAALVTLTAAIVTGWVYRSFLRPRPPRICDSPDGPPVSSPRIKLKDGRHLAYREWGVPKEKSRYRVVLAHGLNDSKDFALNASQELVEKLGIHFVLFDRAGYSESDPNPGRTVKSETMDIQELADQLGLGERFYVIGISMGGYTAWGCIKHIPHRLAGVALVVPVVNYWWPSLPAELTREAYGRLPAADRRMFRIAHHAPWLLHGYMIQRLVTPSKIVALHPDVFSRSDKEILAANPPQVMNKATQQGVHESLYRDIMVGFGDWGFEPLGLADPFPHDEGSVHVWQGAEDRMIPSDLQRYVAGELPWVRYHECPDCGHCLPLVQHWANAILRELLPRREEEEQSAASV